MHKAQRVLGQMGSVCVCVKCAVSSGLGAGALGHQVRLSLSRFLEGDPVPKIYVHSASMN